MVDSEPIPEQDGPHEAAIQNSRANGTVQEEEHQRKSTSVSGEHTPEPDEFGLPVKRSKQRSGNASPSQYSFNSEDAEGQSGDMTNGELANGTGSRVSLKHDTTGSYETSKVLREDSNTFASEISQRQDNQNTLPDDRISPSDPGTNVRSSPSRSSRVRNQQDAESSPTQGDVGTNAVGEPPNRASGLNGVKPEDVAIVDDLLHGGATGGASGWSHQALAPHKPLEDHEEEEQWQDMPAYAPFDMYDDNNKLIAREAKDSDDEADAYAGLGGAGKGYTKVQLDDDAQSVGSMDENTDYLFKPKGTNLADEDDDQRDPLAQLQATKDLLTEGQKLAYVGATKLAMAHMIKELNGIETTKNTKKILATAVESMKMWSQQMMVRLYMHMEINASEQVMIEQLVEHGVEAADLTPSLMQNARVKNPMAEEERGDSGGTVNTNAPDAPSNSPKPHHRDAPADISDPESVNGESPPPYEEHMDGAMPEARGPSQLGTSKNIDIDIRWTVLCDLFLVLIADSIYDSRSRKLLECVAQSLDVSWQDVCRFEKRVTDSLEMQEAATKEKWDEAEHLEDRRKRALKKRYMMMGLATVGGSLVIGLSAGLLAPVIGAGLAAGFTTIGVAGTSGFLAGAGGTALITSGAVITGGTIGVRASNRRMGAVRTFEYRPLHNNKRVNLIVTISGWMNGQIDDVRLPFSTVDPVMGDMYSVLWEPEMLQSMGDTIKVLATEALTQSIQQVLGSTILVALMASLQLPIVLTKLSYLIDNPWTVSMGRANAAGLILADSLIDRNLGVRPITLVGFSLGARVIFAALRELANKGAYGLVQNVYLFGSPIVANKDEYLRVRAVISGRFVNGYASNDWILGYLFRATSGGIMRVSGLAPVEGIPGLENIDVTSLVNGHMAYRAAMPKLLRKVGWEVESDEFTEIEDPDPDNHEKRQRELIRELDEARKEAEGKPEKKRFGFFKKGKLAEKKGWETYDDSMRKEDWGTTAVEGGGGNILFDIEAIKAELLSEQIEVKQLESTLPPMKLDMDDISTQGQNGLRPQKSSSLPSTGERKENPFDKGYDEYNLSEEVISQHLSVGHNKLSFESPLPSPLPDTSKSTDTLPQRLTVEEQHSQHASSIQTSPALHSPFTTYTSDGGNPSLEHNAWADEDDPDFGKEQEVKLSF